LIVIKHKYIAARGKGGVGKVAGIGKALAHVKYIQHRPGEDRERNGREMFNDQEDRLNPRDMRQAIKDLGNSKVIVHKLILSPEVTPEDKKSYTRDVMKNLSRHKGSDLDWFAVEHNNTDHHHIHVVVLGKDRNGTEVSLNLRDIDQAKEFSDRYIERHYPREFEKARDDRELKERERLEARKQEQKERIGEGLELPWMKKNIIREQLEPYKKWKEKPQAERNKSEVQREKEDRPYFNDTIEAAGREWSKANSLEELRTLHEHLWDNYHDRIPKDEYLKLTGWIRDKERAKARADKPKGKDRDSEDRPEKTSFEYNGKAYTSQDSYKKLTGLAKELRDKKERLPFEDYQNLRNWIEDRDRARFDGAIDKAMNDTIQKTERSKSMEQLKAQEGGRVIDPMQEHLFSNPVMGLYMKFASLANDLVRSIPLTENRDHLKDNRDDLEKARAESAKEPSSDLDKEAHERKEQRQETLEKGIEKNEAAQKERDRKAKQKKEDKEREDRDRENFERNWWGR
jgi:type IV secretory pathway VirD2 relaxase